MCDGRAGRALRCNLAASTLLVEDDDQGPRRDEPDPAADMVMPE
jgi:hypothetical protein